MVTSFSIGKATDMTRRFVDQLGDGDNIDEVYLVADKQLRANRNGNLYLQLELRDRTGAMGARLWNASDGLARSFEAGDFLLVKGKVQLFQGALQMILTNIDRIASEKVELTEFLPHTDQDVDKLLLRLRGYLSKLSSSHLRALADVFLMDDDFVRGFCHAPAGIRNHHAYVGGLLEHVVNLMDVADRILPLYPDLDRDILMMGIFLHDVGKVRELSYDRAFAYTDEGQLIGHLVIGVEMLAERVKQVPELTGDPFPTELLLRLKHLILSHHGTYEFGSPKLPMTAEAIALHHLDNLDAKVHSFTRDIRDDRSGGTWTPFNQSLQRRLFRGQGNGRYSSTLDGD
jgi:3'-5' exoribonuclease